MRSYKRLSRVQRAFRSLKSVDLKVRPVFHRTADRARAHVLLCLLAYYVEWHMRKRLAPLLYDDEHPAAADAACESVVSPVKVSESAQRKVRRRRTDDGYPRPQRAHVTRRLGHRHPQHCCSSSTGRRGVRGACSTYAVAGKSL